MIYEKCVKRINNASTIKQAKPNFIDYSNYKTPCGLFLSKSTNGIFKKTRNYTVRFKDTKLDLSREEKELLFNQLMKKKEELKTEKDKLNLVEFNKK